MGVVSTCLPLRAVLPPSRWQWLCLVAMIVMVIAIRFSVEVPVKAVLLCLTLLFLLSVCCVGCGIGRPPVKTLDQWQAEQERVRSRGD